MTHTLLLTVLGFLPGFLVGGASVQINADIELDPQALGIATALFFLTAGVLAAPAGRAVQMLDPRRAWVLCLTTCAAGLTVLATAQTYGVLLVGLVIGGAGNALSQPMANRILSLSVHERLGLAFGIKQAAVPAAAVAAGLAVPTIALTIGWRWAFLAGALVAGIAAGMRPATSGSLAQSPPLALEDVGMPRRGFVLLIAGAGLGAAASTAMVVFFTSSAVEIGIGHGAAAGLLAALSLMVILLRVILGWRVDGLGRTGPYVLLATLLAGGTLGFVLMASPSSTVFVIGAAVAFGTAWAWTGIFEFCIVRGYRRTAAQASGLAQSGIQLGAAAGPMAFGALASAHSSAYSWLAMAFVSVAAGLFTARAARCISACGPAPDFAVGEGH